MHTIPLDDLDSHTAELHVSPSAEGSDLGMISPVSGTLELTLLHSSSTLSITQSVSSLKSAVSSTGFMIWKICPLFMQWLVSEVDMTGKFVFELGSGVGGLGPLIVGKQCREFVGSDQWHLLKLLKRNIVDNLSEVGLQEKVRSETMDLSPPKRRPISTVRLEVCCFDWEEVDQGLFNLREVNIGKEYPDYIIGCDLIYNDYLIPFLIESIIRLSGPDTKIILGLQLRLIDNVEAFLEQLLSTEVFNVSVVDEFPSEFKELRTGFVVYYLERK